MVVVVLVCGVARGVEAEVKPERIDVVYANLVEQQQALEAVAEIVSRLEVVAEYPEAARALLSDQGEPTERLRRALDGVATKGRKRLEESLRLANARAAHIEGQAQAEAPEAVEGNGAELAEESWLDPADVSVVYAEEAIGGGRVVLSVMGTHYAVPEGASVWVGDVLLEVVRVKGGAVGIVVEMRMDRGVPFSRRVRG